MLNNVSLVGRLTKNPELKALGDNYVCNFTLAINRTFKNKNGEKDTDFIQCQAWNNQAEFITTYLLKGQLVAVTGEIRSRSYQKDDGSTSYVTEVNVNSIQSLEKKIPQTVDGIKAMWTREWDHRVVGLNATEKAKLKAELEAKYKPMIQGLKAVESKFKKNEIPSTKDVPKVEDDLPF